MSAMEELETLLQSLQALKPPGVTKTKIDGITAKCVENVQSDSTIVQKIVQQFRNSPATHKLGVLYVVDSVTRQWAEKARAAGQLVSKNAATGTFASGVQKVTDVLPTLMTDIIHSAPDNQKEKISKLLDIWERGQTFPLDMIAGFKLQLSNPQNNTRTPPRSPLKGVPESLGHGSQINHQPPASAPAPVAAPPDTGALLVALANVAHQNGQTNPILPAPAAVPFPQNIVPPPPPPGFMPPPPFAVNGQPFLPPPPGGGDLMQQVLAAVNSGVIPAEQVINVIAALTQGQQPGGVPIIPPPPHPAVTANNQPAAQSSAQPERYEQNGNRYRDRSRSPVAEFSRRRQSPHRRTPPNRRDSPTYGVYDPNASAEGSIQHRNDREQRGRGRGKNRGRGRDRDEHRQRTPPAQRRQPSPAVQAPHDNGPKYLQWDNSMPRDHIRVLSRTLFIGGAGGTEGEIRDIFSRFGKVQTCIVNLDKRHAFVKMVDRRGAVAAKEGMDNIQDNATLSKARQTRWGVGFGPRDCSDYTSGISVIPIARLTDADRKWAVTAEYGGTGGLPLKGGMVMEEPDIEIGAGVSSKAISRRIPPEAGRRAGGNHGFGQRGGFDNSPRFRKQDRQHAHEARHISPRPEPNVAVPPAVPGFGFQLPGF